MQNEPLPIRIPRQWREEGDTELIDGIHRVLWLPGRPKTFTLQRVDGPQLGDDIRVNAEGQTLYDLNHACRGPGSAYVMWV